MKLVTPLALSAVALLAAGCGNTAPSNAGFAAKADAICASFSAADAKLSSSEGAAAMNSEEALLASTLTKLQALSAPFDRGAAYQAFLYEFAQVQPLLRRLSAATAAHDDAKIRSLETQARTVEKNGSSSANEAGLKGCD
ncbi:MAG TPA: hypothetical protein VIJ20_11650 [Solirubrobacteraceae bacterium]